MSEKVRLPLLATFACIAATLAAATYDVRTYGAAGDGRTKDTAAIQRAVDAAADAGGGTVVVPSGTYLTGSVSLRSNVDLHLGAGAELLASTNREDYNRADVCPQNWTDRSESCTGEHLILCIGQTNVTVRGPGRINGNSRAFLVGPGGERWPQGGIPFRPAQMLYFVESQDLRFDGFELKDSSYWNLFIYGCERVSVRGLWIHNVREGFHTHNGDGIDIDCSRHVSVRDCRIDVADDCVTLRADGAPLVGSPPECADVTVSGCELSSACNAIRVGVGDGRIHDARFSDIVIRNTRTGISIVSSWSSHSRGVDISDIVFSGFRVSDCFEFVQLEPMFAKRAVFENLTFENCSGVQEIPSCVIGNADLPAKNIRFRNVSFPHGVYARRTEGLEIEGGDFREVQVTDDQIRAFARRKFQAKLRFWDMLTPRLGGFDGPVVAKLADSDRFAALDPRLAKAFAFLRRPDLATLPPGRYEIDGAEVFAIIQDGKPLPYPQAKGELHRSCIDIHAPLIGRETIGVCEVAEPNVLVRQPFDEKQDVGFYDMPAPKALELVPGDFALLFPTVDLHMPRCTSSGEPRLKKALVKVRIRK